MYGQSSTRPALGAPRVRSKFVNMFLGVLPWQFIVPAPRMGCCKVCRWISSSPKSLSPHDQRYLAARGDASLQCTILGCLPWLSSALSPCQRLKLSTLRWLQLKSTLIFENMDRNLNVTLNMCYTSPSTGFFMRGAVHQHLTLAARGKSVTNTLNIFAFKHDSLADFVSSTFFFPNIYPN